MKKIMFVFPVLLMLLFTQCQNDDNVQPDEMLIAEIEQAQNKVDIQPDALPEEIQEQVELDYFDSYIETAAHVPGKGYEVVLGNEDQLYFRENGLQLRGGPLGPHRPGPCGRGILVPGSDLPGEIITYITTNYPDAEILRAKLFPQRGYLVLISGRRILIFDNTLNDYAFVAETRAFYFCDLVGHPIDIANLPDAVTTYISTNYPDGEIVKAFLVRGRIVVGILTPDGRKILVFDAQGNFLFARG